MNLLQNGIELYKEYLRKFGKRDKRTISLRKMITLMDGFNGTMLILQADNEYRREKEALNTAKPKKRHGKT